jgi:hypothetical protein
MIVFVPIHAQAISITLLARPKAPANARYANADKVVRLPQVGVESSFGNEYLCRAKK